MKLDTRVAGLVQPLLERNPDLVRISSERLCLLPVRHMAREICFVQHREQYFLVEWHMADLFVPVTRPDREPGWFMKTIKRSKLVRALEYYPRGRPSAYPPSFEYLNWGDRVWDFEDPEVADDLVLQVENALRMMRSLDELIKCVAYMRSDGAIGGCTVRQWYMLMDIALGHIHDAAEQWGSVRREYLDRWVAQPRSHAHKTDNRYVALDVPLMNGDRLALARLLHDWEAENVKGTKIERFWQPTPFPLEQVD